jgi:hypothetical protein
MIRRTGSRHTPSPGSAGSDTDALQTDVMRFMSILGLCLMAVFALVQSLPLHEVRSTLRESDVMRLHRDIALQQQRADALETELDRLNTQIQRTQARELRAQQALASVREQLSAMVQQTQQARRDRNRVVSELEALRHRLVQAREELAGIEQAAVNKARTLGELRQRLDRERTKLDEIEQRTETLQLQRAQTLAQSVSEAPPLKTADTEPEGFSLRFASVEALERLVDAGRVSLYALSGKRAWRLSLRMNEPFFASSAFPGWFHEMAAATVPAGYVRSLASANGGSEPSSVVWGVQLPSAATRQIASLTRSARGGSLVIGADGQVRLE